MNPSFGLRLFRICVAHEPLYTALRLCYNSCGQGISSDTGLCASSGRALLPCRSSPRGGLRLQRDRRTLAKGERAMKWGRSRKLATMYCLDGSYLLRLLLAPWLFAKELALAGRLVFQV